MAEISSSGELYDVPDIRSLFIVPRDNFEIHDLPFLPVNQFHNMLSRIAVMVPRTVNPEPSSRAHRILVRVDPFPDKIKNSGNIPLWAV
jgi:hypothetical protein